MKLLIAGSRDIILTLEQFDAIIENTPIPIQQITEVVSGGCNGIDSIGEWWAECRPDYIPIKQFLPDWNKHGKAAGPIRNKQMAEYADAALVIWDGKSRGSKNMIDNMKKLNKPVHIVYV